MANKLTTEDFVIKAKTVHGNRYDYSKVIYSNTSTKVLIICLVHGAFHQTPNGHLSGRGCSKCVGKDKNTSDFVQLANIIHNYKYDYSQTNYKLAKSKIAIICRQHGTFFQTPSGHLSGKGCSLCANNLPKQKIHFINEANIKHFQKYSYDKVVLENNKTKIIITCPIHGDFFQTPKAHLKGSGCRQCGGTAPISKKEWISKAEKTHSKIYKYDKVNFRNMKTKVLIGCSVHGYFYQTPCDHVNQKSGCPKCVGKNKTTLDFINQVRRIHGMKYDYSETHYVSAKKKVKVLCIKHGTYLVTPSNHINGKGCPRCCTSHGESIIRTYLLKTHIRFDEQVKYRDCKHIKQLPFDFRISQKTTTLLIEYQGEQHYRIGYWLKHKTKYVQMEALSNIQHRDQIKAQWCKNNNVPLLVIPYWDKHRIPELLEDFLVKHS